MSPRNIRVYALAAKNLRKKFIRTMILLLSVATVTSTLCAASVFMMSMQTAFKIGTYRLGADILVVPKSNEAEARTTLLAGEPVAFYFDKNVLDKVSAVEGVEAVSPQIFINPSSFTCCYTVDVFLIGFDQKSDFTIKPWLDRNIDRPLKLNEVIVGRSMPVLPGDTIAFFGSMFTVAGVMEPTGMNFFDRSVFMNLEAAYQMAEHSTERAQQKLEITRNQVSAILIKVDDAEAADRVALKIESAVDGIKAIASEQIVSTVRKQLNALMKGITIIAAVLWAIVLLLVGFTFSMLVNERQRELGILRSMGAKKAHIFKLIMFEALYTSLAGGIAGVVAAGALLHFMSDTITKALKLPYLIPSVDIVVIVIASSLAFALFTGLVAALIPALRASGLDPYEAIRKGE